MKSTKSLGALVVGVVGSAGLMAVIAAGPAVALTPVGTHGAAAGQRAVVDEALVTCVDSTSGGSVDGLNAVVLTKVDPSETEAVPAGTATAKCTNSALSDRAVALTAIGTDGRKQTVTIQPGQDVYVGAYVLGILQLVLNLLIAL